MTAIEDSLQPATETPHWASDERLIENLDSVVAACRDAGKYEGALYAILAAYRYEGQDVLKEVVRRSLIGAGLLPEFEA